MKIIGLPLLIATILFSSAVNAQDYPNQISDPCNGRNQGFARDMNSCNHYFFCQNGRGIRGVCNNNRLFEGEREVCVTSNNRPCFECSRERSYHLNSVPRACHQYIQCFQSQATLHVCPPGLVYDGRRDVRQCNLPPEQGDCYREDDDSETPETPTCPEITNRPVFLRHPNSCSIYYICTGSAPERLECPDGLHFNLNLGVCDHPLNANCETNPSNPPPTPPDGIQSGPAYRCSGIGEMIPDRRRCNYYHICTANDTVEDRCTGTLLFDTVSRRCAMRNNAQCFPGTVIPPRSEDENEAMNNNDPDNIIENII